MMALRVNWILLLICNIKIYSKLDYLHNINTVFVNTIISSEVHLPNSLLSLKAFQSTDFYKNIIIMGKFNNE